MLTGGIFLAVFGGALGDRLDVAGVDYVRFILPGLLVMTVAGQAFANNSTSLFQAKNEATSKTFSPARCVHGRWWRATWPADCCAPGSQRSDCGWSPGRSPAGSSIPALTALALVLTGLIFAALGVITGMWADTFDQHAFIANVLITPLALVAGVFYAVERLAQPWQTLTYLDPIFYLVDATRHGYTGVHETTTAVALTVAAVVAAAVFALAVTLLRRGWRLLP